ncbi:MAG: ABC transporter ATP-binding protein [Acidimicrobiales bacterium]
MTRAPTPAPDWTTPATAFQRLKASARAVGLAVRLTWRASPLFTAVLLVALALEAALRPVQLALSAAVVDRAVGGGDILTLAVVAGLALAAGHVLSPVASTAQSLAGDRLTAYIGEELIGAANRWPGLARFEDPDFQDDLHRARTRAGRGGLDVVVYGARSGLALFTAVSLALVLAGLHPLVPVLLVAASLPSIASQYVANNRTGSHLYIQTPDARRLDYCRDVLLAPEPAKDVRLFAAGRQFRRRYDEIFEATTSDLHLLRRRLTVKVVLAEALSAAAAAVGEGDLSPGAVVLYGGAVTMFRETLSVLGFDVGFLPWVLAFLPSLFRVLDAEPDLPVANPPVPTPHPLRGGIAFEDVSFAYAGRDAPALDGLNLRIGAGECVALVGHNGAGKTTVVKLLLRLYDPDAGRVLVDGIDLRDLDPVDLRRHLGVIFQDFVRYELTAGENVGLGNVERLGDEAAVHDAVRRAGAGALLDVLPDGLGTALGRQFGGRELSEGEWQKLALARALMRDCPVLVLDEPTASLDVQTEFHIYRRFRELTRDRTTLLVSHRLSTVRLADRIVFLSNGRVGEEGSHDALMAAGGDYARLFRMQAEQHL